MHGLPRLTPGHALFLDFDGTLVDIASQPDAVRVEDGLVPALQSLHHFLQGALAIITGRTLADIDHYLAPLRLNVASEHGAQHRHHAATGVDRSVSSPDLRAAEQRLKAALLQYPDLLLEPKTAGLALHYRNAPALEPICAKLMDDIARDMPGMEILRGKCVLELKPAGPNKGRAVQEFMQLPPFNGRTPIFVGDDVTDEAAFVAVQQMGGIGIKVGHGTSVAAMRVESAAQVRAWLQLQPPSTSTGVR